MGEGGEGGKESSKADEAQARTQLFSGGGGAGDAGDLARGVKAGGGGPAQKETKNEKAPKVGADEEAPHPNMTWRAAAK